ncbi:MAG: DUF4395 domain-containing protein [Mycobacteriaceae bacterium]
MSTLEIPRRLDSVDVRGPRFAAWVTTAVLAVVLLTGSGILLALQAAVFAIGAACGPRRSPYGWLYAHLVAPRLSAATEREPVAPLRFAQAVGFGFALIGTVGFVLGAPALGFLATAAALVAALLNAAFGLCLGCRLYPLVALARTRTRH